MPHTTLHWLSQMLGLLVDTSQGCQKNKSILINRDILSAYVTFEFPYRVYGWWNQSSGPTLLESSPSRMVRSIRHHHYIPLHPSPEYVVMDPLMELVARLLPSLNHQKERGDFIHGTFCNEMMENAFGKSATIGLGNLFNGIRGDNVFEVSMNTFSGEGQLIYHPT